MQAQSKSAKPSRPRNAAALRDAFAAPHPPEEALEEGFHGAVLDQIALPPLSRGERWRAALARMGLPASRTLREKLAARRAVEDLHEKFGAEGGALTHPVQLAPFLEALLDMDEDAYDERAALESGLAGLLIEYRYKYSIQRGLMCYYSKIAKKFYAEGKNKQRIISKITNDDERRQTIDIISYNYFNFIRQYFFACLTREDVLKGPPLLADFIAAVLFLSRIGKDGTLEKEPRAERLPLRDHILFAAMRDPATIRAAADENHQRRTSAAIKEFPA